MINATQFLETIYPHHKGSICIAERIDGKFYNKPFIKDRASSLENKETYVCVSTCAAVVDGKLSRKRENLLDIHAVILDDVGTKTSVRIPTSPTAVIETSPLNFQYIYRIEPIDVKKDGDEYDTFMEELAAAGYTDPEVSLRPTCIYRLPGSINKKNDKNFVANVPIFSPEKVWTLAELRKELLTDTSPMNDEVLNWLDDNKKVTGKNGDWFEIECPWRDTHTSEDGRAGYAPLGRGKLKAKRGFKCHHSHCRDKTISHFLIWLAEQGGPEVDDVLVAVANISNKVTKKSKVRATTSPDSRWIACKIMERFATLAAQKGESGSINGWYQWNDETGWDTTTYGMLSRYAIRELTKVVGGKFRYDSSVKDGIKVVTSMVDVHPEEEWNTSTVHIPFKDVVKGVDLATGNIVPTLKETRMSKRLPIEPAGAWRGGYWHECLKDWLDNEDDIKSLLRLIGQGLAGNPEQRFVFLYGTGGTGKSAFIAALENALGDFAATLSIDYITAPKGKFTPHPTGLQCLEHARVIFSGEIPVNVQWNEEILKNISGGDKIAIRGMREDFREVKCRSLLVVYGNHRPILRDVGTSMQRRLVVVPFDKIVSKEKRVDFIKLTDKLKEAGPEILASVVEGLADYRANGLNLSETFSEESEDYIASEDAFGNELERICFKTDKETLANLCNALRESMDFSWLKPRQLGGMLRDRGYTVKPGTHGVLTVRGLSLRQSAEDRGNLVVINREGHTARWK